MNRTRLDKTSRGLAIQALLFFLLLWPPCSVVAIELEVKIEGLEGAMLENAQATLGLLRHKDSEQLRPVMLRRLYKKGSEEIRKALEPFGYYGAEVTAVGLSEEQRKPAVEGGEPITLWRAEYRVAPGEPVRIRELDLHLSGPGQADEALQKALAEFPLKLGEALTHADYEAGKAKLAEAAAERGYFDYRLERHQIEVRPSEHRAAVHLHIDSGPRYRYGEVRFEQPDQHIFDEAFLRRFLPFDSGAPYQSEDLLKLQVALGNTSYFSRVEITPLKEEAKDDQVPLRVVLIPRPRQRYSFGLGYGTDTGPRLTLDWEHRRINETGHHADAEMQLSPVLSKLKGRYEIPLEQVTTDAIEFSTNLERQDADVRFLNLSLGAAYRWMGEDGWQRRLYTQGLFEDYQLGEDDSTASIWLFGGRLDRTQADDQFDTRHGYRVNLELRGAAAALLSATDLVQLRASAKYIDSLDELNRFLLRADLGMGWTSDFSQVPPSLRFFAGGDNSVRGYGYQELGPQDASGEVIGGSHLLVFSAEYERRLFGDWGAALFADAGNAFDDRRFGLKGSLGFGARWHSPVGPIRLDLAFPQEADAGAWRIHLGIGPDL